MTVAVARHDVRHSQFPFDSLKAHFSREAASGAP